MQVTQTVEEKITRAELRAAVALWAQENAPNGHKSCPPMLGDMAEALGVEEAEARRLLGRVRHNRGRRLVALWASACALLTACAGVVMTERVNQHRATAEAQYAAFLASPEHLRQEAKWKANAAKREHEVDWREYRGRYFAGNDVTLTDVQMLRSRGQDSLAYKARLERARRGFEAGLAAERELAQETGADQGAGQRMSRRFSDREGGHAAAEPSDSGDFNR